jgi:hypothetical protein
VQYRRHRCIHTRQTSAEGHAHMPCTGTKGAYIRIRPMSGAHTHALYGMYRSYKTLVRGRTIAVELLGCGSLLYFVICILSGLFSQFGSLVSLESLFNEKMI